MGKIKKYIIIICICMIALILSGCFTSDDYYAFRDLTCNCVDNDESMILELFGMYDSNIITGINKINNMDNTNMGIVIEYNNKKYYVVTSEGKNADTNNKLYIRACEIASHLMNEYPIIGIDYYQNLRCMEIWFSEDFIDIDWGIIYYPPGVSPPKDVSDKEHSEEIKDGFYTYLWFKGF